MNKICTLPMAVGGAVLSGVFMKGNFLRGKNREDPEDLLKKFESLSLGFYQGFSGEQTDCFSVTISFEGTVCYKGHNDHGKLETFFWTLSEEKMLNVMKILVDYNFRTLNSTFEHMQFLDLPEYSISIQLKNGEVFSVIYDPVKSFLPREVAEFDIEICRALEISENLDKRGEEGKKCWRQIELFSRRQG